MASVSVVLSSIKTSADNAKLLREKDVSVEKAETKLKLAELVGALADAKFELCRSSCTILEKAKIKTLEERASHKKNVVWEVALVLVHGER